MSERLYEGDRVLVQATVIRATPGFGVLVEMVSKTDQYQAWVRWADVTPVMEDLRSEPPDGTWLVGDDHDDGSSSVFHRDDAEGHSDQGRRYDRHWWDYSASEWIDWPTALRRGANPDNRLRPAADTWRAEAAAAEARGYQRAITALRQAARVADLCWQANTSVADGAAFRDAADHLVMIAAKAGQETPA